MEVIDHNNKFTPKWDKCVLTMGDFDGIHKGHRGLIKRTIKKAKEEGLPPVLLTYEPSPKKVLQKLKHDSNIYTKSEKIFILKNYGLEAVIFLPFDQEMARFTAKKFLKNILLDQLNCARIIIGYDHKFGLNRHGNYKYLNLSSKRYGFTFEKIKPIKLFQKVASSTEIRNFLREGNIRSANQLLAAPYFIQSDVIEGKKRGSGLGIPTANLRIPKDKLIPKKGVYFSIAEFHNKKYKAVVNIGRNPTFENTCARKGEDISVEAHILGLNKSLYHKQLSLFFLERIRDEQKFSNANELVKQIHKDIAYTEKLIIPTNLTEYA